MMMRPRISQMAAAGNGYNYLDDGEIPPEPSDPNMPRLRGGDASTCAHGFVGYAGPTSSNGLVRLPPHGAEGYAESDFDVVSATDFYEERRSHCQRVLAPGEHALAEGYFNFNDQQQPNPWQGVMPEPQRPCEQEHLPEFDVMPEVRRFSTCRNDRDLRSYMDARHISPGFLTEIDQFLEGHPEIATCAEGRSTLRQLYTLSPLESYKYFLKGYTRPARYIDGIVRTDNFPLPPGYPYQPLSIKTDPELVDFFDGFDYRHDIINRIDKNVRMAMRELAYGESIPLALRNLVCYAIWGNPVDAYKWFEYSYQEDYMPHRYLPEHVVLGHVPKPVGYKVPRPVTDSSFKKHGVVRARMARANDQGIDVLDVLIAEYRCALVRRAHRRLEIDNLVLKAKQRLDDERRDPTGVDVVDFIMDDAVARQGANRRYATSRLSSHRFTSYGARFNRGRYTFTRVSERRAPPSLQAEGGALQAAKAVLLRLYSQELHAMMREGMKSSQSTLQMVRSSRATAERRYVNCLIRYYRAANRMTPTQANELQKHFTREKMGMMRLPNSNYLLGIYPRELY